MEKATFGAGCFWGVEKAFYELEGVTSTRVGYAGGTMQNPTYKQVCRGDTGHAEVVEVTFDPKIISYEKLLDTFWKIHEGPDVGSQYRSVIFTHTKEQEKLAKASKVKMASRFKRPIVTEILPEAPFYEAEAYHQKHFKGQ